MIQGDVIGVVGGLGAYAGLDLVQKIFDQTIAHRDQEHLPLALVSFPQIIGNRSDYLDGEGGRNPADGIITALKQLEAIGATIVGIPCNTSHADTIFDSVSDYAKGASKGLRLVSMVDEVINHIDKYHEKSVQIGVLATTGTIRAQVYHKRLESRGYRIITLDDSLHTKLHAAIHDDVYGIKAESNPVTRRAQAVVNEAINDILNQGAEVVVLGCTELPLAIGVHSFNDIPLVDSTLVLARALIRECNSQQLKPWPVAYEELNTLSLG